MNITKITLDITDYLSGRENATSLEDRLWDQIHKIEETTKKAKIAAARAKYVEANLDFFKALGYPITETLKKHTEAEVDKMVSMHSKEINYNTQKSTTDDVLREFIKTLG